MVGGLPSGKLADTHGYRTLCVLGVIVSTAATLAMPLMIDAHTNFWKIAAVLLVTGFGWGLFNSPISSIGMLCVNSNRRASSSALRVAFTMLAQMVSIVLVFRLTVGSLPPNAVAQLFLTGKRWMPSIPVQLILTIAVFFPQVVALMPNISMSLWMALRLSCGYRLA
jgi:MFS family permease